MKNGMRIGIISFTEAGKLLAEAITEKLFAEQTDYEIESESLSGRSREWEEKREQLLKPDTISENGELLDTVTKASGKKAGLQEITGRFMKKDVLLFIGACGIAVRAIAPFIRDKKTDPAVIVMDEKAGFVIPILSGHIGGANEFGTKLAELLGSQLVLTTATDVNAKFAIDVFAVKNGLYIYSMKQLKQFSAALLQGRECGILFSNRTTAAEEKRPYETTAVLMPQNIYIGVGCRKGKDAQEFRDFCERVIGEYDICTESIAAIVSIDLKKDEQALLKLADHWGVQTVFYPAEILQSAQGDFTASEFVSRITGVDNVCERSAWIASQGGRCLVSKKAEEGMTIAVYEKHVFLKGMPADIPYDCDSCYLTV